MYLYVRRNGEVPWLMFCAVRLRNFFELAQRSSLIAEILQGSVAKLISVCRESKEASDERSIE